MCANFLVHTVEDNKKLTLPFRYYDRTTMRAYLNKRSLNDKLHIRYGTGSKVKIVLTGGEKRSFRINDRALSRRQPFTTALSKADLSLPLSRRQPFSNYF